jgi:sugar phosphate isomerase/epimerase
MAFVSPFLMGTDIYALDSSPKHTFKEDDTICAFSKIFQWLDYDSLAGFLSEAGFEGIDLSVRPGGHILPDNVEKDLPKAVKAAQKHGLTIPMIATAITDVSDPVTKRILKAASDTGVKYYRLGYYRYDEQLDATQNLEKVKKSLNALGELNAKYGLQGGYQNHVGNFVGSPVWDLWYAIKDLDPEHIGCQYDVRHAVADGLSCWMSGYRAIASHIKHVCIKDFTFRQDNNGKWGVRSVPLGTGAVDFNTYFKIRKQCNISGPLSIHYEFPIEGDIPSLSPGERMKKILPTIRKEADTLRTMIKNSNQA